MSVPEIVLGSIIGVLLYFLKVIHSDVRRNTNNMGENKGAITEVKAEIRHEREMRTASIEAIRELFHEIKADLKDIKNKQ